MAYIREYSPGPDVAGHLILDLVDLSQNYQSKPDDFDHKKMYKLRIRRLLHGRRTLFICTCTQLFDHCTTVPLSFTEFGGEFRNKQRLTLEGIDEKNRRFN